MKGLAKFMLLVFGILSLEFAALAVAAAVIVWHYGFLTIREHKPWEDHTTVVSLPAVLVNGPIDFARCAVRIAGHGHRSRHQVPDFSAAAAAIDSAPDFTLLTVDRPGERVRIEKKNGKVELYAQGHEGNVHITMPGATLRKAAALAEEIAKHDDAQCRVHRRSVRIDIDPDI